MNNSKESVDEILDIVINAEREFYRNDTKRKIENHRKRRINMSKFKELRKASGLTQKELAERSGVNVRIIQHYEQGFRDINKAEAMTVYKLSEALKCNMEELLENDLKKGEWISLGDWILVCSECDGAVKDSSTDEFFKYCPHCSKPMLPGRKEE